MQSSKKLSLSIAGAAALTMIFGTSAFAESRHISGTSRGSGGHVSGGNISRSSSGAVNRDRSFTPSARSTSERSSSTWRGDRGTRVERDVTRDVTRETTRVESRSSDWRGNRNSGRVESRGNARVEGSRSSGRVIENDARWSRFRGSNAWTGRGTPYRGQSYYGYGRVNRYERCHGGYRVWIGGGLYPIFVPFSYWARFPLHIGLSIRFGGFWDPFGYWSIADYAPYDEGFYDGYRAGVYADGGGYNRGYNDGYTRGSIRGVIESIDLYRGSMVVNDDISRQFVTVRVPRDRRLDFARPGDYIELSGDWTRDGVFDAYRVERIGDGRDGYRDDDRY